MPCSIPGLPSHPQHDVALRQFRPGRRRRDARLRGRRRPRRRPGGDRRAHAPRTDRLARQRPHDGRPPAVDVAPPVDRGGAARRRHHARAAARVGRARGPRRPPGGLRGRARRRPRRAPGGPFRRSARSRSRNHREPGGRLGGLDADRPIGTSRPGSATGCGACSPSVDFAVVQIIFLALLAVVGMTIRQLPDFAFRSADGLRGGDGRPARPLRPGPGRGHRRRPRAARRCSRSSARRGSVPGWSCWSSRSSCARSTGRRGCGAASATIRVAQPEPFFDPRLPDRAAMDGVPADDGAGRPAAQRLPRPRGDRRRRHALPVRRPPPVHEAGDAAHPRRARSCSSWPRP